MAGSSLGSAFVVTTAGESHGPANVVIVDGCPAGVRIDEALIQRDLDRRRPGQSALVSQRSERDRAEILSGVTEGESLGTPIAILIRNEDARPKDYDALRDQLRPGHADFTTLAKYGVRDPRGGGRASARETVARVAAGAIARQLLAQALGAEILGYVVQVGDVIAEVPGALTRAAIEAHPTRCPDPIAAAEIATLIEALRAEGDSIGGVAEIVATNIPAGLGEPVFDKLKADLGKALFSIPAVVGVEFGAGPQSGFAAARLRGSEHNDAFFVAEAARAEATEAAKAVKTATNRHGGILGGISSGMPIVARAALKPASSIKKTQQSVTSDLQPVSLTIQGRHDPCLLPRFVPIAEAMFAITLADHWLRQAPHRSIIAGWRA